MLIGAEAKKEKLISLRAEYAALFTHFHFFQGLRFAVLAATLPIVGALFNYYRTALPLSRVSLSGTSSIIKSVYNFWCSYHLGAVFGMGAILFALFHQFFK